MTLEQKAEAYDKAIEKIKYVMEQDVSAVLNKEDLQDIFPELREFEDEIMRKYFIMIFKRMLEEDNLQPLGTVEASKLLAWLKKQGDKDKLIKELGKYKVKYTQEVLSQQLEKQGDSPIKWNKNIEGNKPQVNHSVLMKTTHGIAEGEWKGEYWYQYRWSSTVNDSDVLFWMELSDLEKQGEKKSIFNANNWYVVSKVDGKIHNIYNSGVEPKFHKDEWVVNNATLNLCHILRVEHGQYICDDCSFPITKENDYHLWSIADAKPGDVLCWNDSNCVALFKNIYDTETFNSYGSVGHCTGIFNTKLPYHDIEGAHPATKEQRELLFQRMKEAGYIFDFEKKELKKLKFRVGDEVINENEESLTITRIDEKGYWSNDLFICDFDESIAWDFVGKVKQKFKIGDWVVISTTKGDRVVQIASVQSFTKDGYPSYITTEGSWFGNGTKARLLTDKDVEITTIPENKAIVNKIESWCKDDEELYQDALDAFEALANGLNPSEDWEKLYDWLNSIKQRMGGDDYERK